MIPPRDFGIYRYIRHQHVAAHLALGWMIAADLGPTHGQWSVLMWHCDCGDR